jgi:hypothetical protein
MTGQGGVRDQARYIAGERDISTWRMMPKSGNNFSEEHHAQLLGVDHVHAF